MNESSSQEDFFEVANLFPADTGLPMVIWVSERGRARHDVRINVNQSHGTRMLPGNLARLAMRPAPRLIARQLSAADLQAVSDWIPLNEAAGGILELPDQHRRADAAAAAVAITDRPTCPGRSKAPHA